MVRLMKMNIHNSLLGAPGWLRSTLWTWSSSY